MTSPGAVSDNVPWEPPSINGILLFRLLHYIPLEGSLLSISYAQKCYHNHEPSQIAEEVIGSFGYGEYYELQIPINEELERKETVEIYVGKDKLKDIKAGRAGEIIRLDLELRKIPDRSALLQNYPNPFNPDTWIPYQLKDDADVAIRIYASTGQLVRTLSLGQKPAGFYTDREKAAYWDGKNEAGERMASGVYFYTIRAGDLCTTRKMAIVK